MTDSRRDRPLDLPLDNAISGEESSNKDAEIGQDVQRRLHRMLLRLAQRHGIDQQRATDYLVTGVLFATARSYDLDMPQTLELVRTLGHSVLDDAPSDALRH